MNHFLLAGVISASTIAGLVLMALLIATGRAIFDRGADSQVWTGEADVVKYEAQAATETYPHKVLVALDIFSNVVVFGGRQGETISTHAHIASLEKKVWGKILNGWLDWIQPLHGLKAASGDLERASAEVERMKGLLKWKT